MTVRKQAAFTAGIETARQMALTAAVTLEVRDDAGAVRQQAAAAALQGLAEGLRVLALPDRRGDEPDEAFTKGRETPGSERIGRDRSVLQVSEQVR